MGFKYAIIGGDVIYYRCLLGFGSLTPDNLGLVLLILILILLLCPVIFFVGFCWFSCIMLLTLYSSLCFVCCLCYCY